MRNFTQPGKEPAGCVPQARSASEGMFSSPRSRFLKLRFSGGEALSVLVPTLLVGTLALDVLRRGTVAYASSCPCFLEAERGNAGSHAERGNQEPIAFHNAQLQNLRFRLVSHKSEAQAKDPAHLTK